MRSAVTRQCVVCPRVQETGFIGILDGERIGALADGWVKPGVFPDEFRRMVLDLISPGTPNELPSAQRAAPKSARAFSNHRTISEEPISRIRSCIRIAAAFGKDDAVDQIVYIESR